MKEKRLAWAKKYQKWTKEDWRKVMFSDESQFYVQGQRSQHVRRSAGEELTDDRIHQSMKHPEKKMFWGCFSYTGVGSLRPVDGMMRSPQYIDVIERNVIRDMGKAFPEGRGVFHQDLAPCHTSKAVTEVFKKNNIKLLDWPGNSPDLHPIKIYGQ